MENLLSTVDGIPTLTVRAPASLGEYQLIDVRGPDEFWGELGHIPGARLATLGPELDKFLLSAPPNEKILFICRSGVRSARATQQAQQAGFTQVFNLAGGMLQWTSQGFLSKRETKPT